MKRIFAGTAAVLLAAVLFFPVSVQALSAEKAILVDAATGRVLYEKNADERSLIASTTKIMTALVVCEQCNVLDRMRIPKEAVGIEGSSMYLQEGEVLTLQELLYGLMLHSGNDAAVALAIYCGGTVEGFAEMMNDKARVLGMTQSHFENPNGLDSPGHYSTARDLAILASYAMKNPIFHKTVSTKTVTVGNRYLRNHNKLLWQVAGADGVKTGYTKAAGRILVSSATRDGRRLIAVTINDPDDWNDHGALLEEGFSRYQVRRIVSAGERIGTVEIAGGQVGYAELVAAEDFDYALAPEERSELVFSGPGFVYAPVARGADAGFAHVCIDGKSVGKIPIVFGETVEQKTQEKKSLIQRLFG
ncbi:MAG: D-alanyl-D-alanine carboxypeptidase [Clostridiales bacterium]|nr:D-alanyl-D-alanine carboxypeptidase [Clostridiales bacterium]MDD7387149.1 D-alanyl-D-alanine carboxypeptidase [Bacillota bacterium]